MGNVQCIQCCDPRSRQFNEIDANINVIEKVSPIRLPIINSILEFHLNNHKPIVDQIDLAHKQKQMLFQLRNSKDIYRGTVNRDKQPHGFGIIYFEKGAILQANWTNGKIDQLAHYIYPNGDCVYGELHDGRLSKGEYISDKGSNRYKGQFVNNAFHGRGLEKGIGYQFEGSYHKGMRIEGVFKYNQSMVIEQRQSSKIKKINEKYWEERNNEEYEFTYIGRFDQNAKFTGEGKLITPKGVYIGSFKDGFKHGAGEFVYSSGGKYVGQYVYNKKQGQGTIYSKLQKPKYSGEWKEGLPHGKGYLYNEFGDKMQIISYAGIDEKKLINTDSTQT